MNLNPAQSFNKYLQLNSDKVAAIVDFNTSQNQLVNFDFTLNNKDLSAATVADTYQFSIWINNQLAKNNARYGIGGYNEHRTLYSRSKLFDTMDEPRRLHLGTDIWGPVGTRVYAPLEGKIHSFKFNNHFGDYGATIILEHNLDGLIIHSLYGHLNLASLADLKVGQPIVKGQYFAQFGIPAENGHWPSHLHFQIVMNMGPYKGDYPGVCRFTQREIYLLNCPDPMSVLNYTFK